MWLCRFESFISQVSIVYDSGQVDCSILSWVIINFSLKHLPKIRTLFTQGSLQEISAVNLVSYVYHGWQFLIYIFPKLFEPILRIYPIYIQWQLLFLNCINILYRNSLMLTAFPIPETPHFPHFRVNWPTHTLQPHNIGRALPLCMILAPS